MRPRCRGRRPVAARRRAWLAVWAAMVLGPAGLAPPAAEAASGAFVVAVGEWGLESRDDSTWVADLEYRTDPMRYNVVLLAGGLVNGDGAFHVRAGLGLSFVLGGGWHVTPTSSVGYYDEGDSIDLGHEIEFKSQLEVSYEIGPRYRLGLAVAHLSNAGISDDNPGVETLTANLVVRLGD